MKSPNGKQIIGTVEHVPGTARIIESSMRIEGGSIVFDYDGTTDIDWNTQRTIDWQNQRIFEDEDGNYWLEREVIAANSPFPANIAALITAADIARKTFTNDPNDIEYLESNGINRHGILHALTVALEGVNNDNYTTLKRDRELLERVVATQDTPEWCNPGLVVVPETLITAIENHLKTT